jgi:hypothetical protein
MNIARDAAERIVVEYGPLSSVIIVGGRTEAMADYPDNEWFFFTGDKRPSKRTLSEAITSPASSSPAPGYCRDDWSRAAASVSGTTGSAASRFMSGRSARTALASA